MASAARLPSLLGLSDDELLKIALHLPFKERLQLSLVCHRLRQLCSGASELWRVVEGVLVCRPSAGDEEDERRHLADTILGFAGWLERRLQAVEELRFHLQPGPRLVHECPMALETILRLKPDMQPLPLQSLFMYWSASAALKFARDGIDVSATLPNLRQLVFFGTHLSVLEAPQSLPPLSDFGLIGGRLDGCTHAAWLPASTTGVCFADVALESLPGALQHLPNLRSLVVDHNAQFQPDSLGALSRFSERLEELNLSECNLPCIPATLSALTNLKVCYLHGVVAWSFVPNLGWEALGPLKALSFLSISGNALKRLPEPVAAMSQLRGLHLEDNAIPVLAPAPVFSHLRELVLDWDTALGAAAALRSASHLSRLVLKVLTESNTLPGSLPAGCGEQLLEALAAIPALRLVEEVIDESGVEPPVLLAPAAHVMWRLGRRCPALDFGQLADSNVGWTLSRLLARLSHNKGLTLLPE